MVLRSKSPEESPGPTLYLPGIMYLRATIDAFIQQPVSRLLDLELKSIEI